MRGRSWTQNLILAYGIGCGLLVCWAGFAPSVHACGIDQGRVSSEEVFFRQIRGPCRAKEREALAIQAETLLTALKMGKRLDLRGVVIAGDLMLDRLPLQPLEQLDLPSPPLRQVLKRRGVHQVRVIRGAISIRDSWVHDVIATNLVDGALLLYGDVNMTGTTFERSIDFSKTLFLGSVDFSGAKILYEGFFIGAYFNGPATFTQTIFGTHSRFHKTVFANSARFSRSVFRGLAEFLEVVFQQDAHFAQTAFQVGTGFSGAQFHGSLDFSSSVFTGPAFFRFTTFGENLLIHDSIFHDTADFTQATFKSRPDFSTVTFDASPLFVGTDVEPPPTSSVGDQEQRSLIGLWAVLLLCMLFLIWNLRKGEKGKAAQ